MAIIDCVVIATKMHAAVLALALVSVPGGSHAAIEITDDAENRIVLQQPANRIVSLAPHVTELLFAAGSGDAVVATVDYSDFPAAALDIPRVGNSQTISYETVVGLEPDLVIAWQSGNGSSVIARLKELGLTTYTNEPRQLVDIPRSLRHFGVITGRRSSGERAARAFERRYGTLRDKYSKQKPVTVFYQVWDSPLTTLNGEHLVSDAIRLLRAVAANEPDAYTEQIYWRGMKDLGITGQFMVEGGTDCACVSTTASQEVAVLNFAASSLPLVFRVVTKRGYRIVIPQTAAAYQTARFRTKSEIRTLHQVSDKCLR
ncbi:MAG: helical backbone metal receptor, partial [Gammaproteobacteria bacterium]